MIIKKKEYSAPLLEMVEVKVEKGFAASAENIQDGGSVHRGGVSGIWDPLHDTESAGSLLDNKSFSKKYF